MRTIETRPKTKTARNRLIPQTSFRQSVLPATGRLAVVAAVLAIAVAAPWSPAGAQPAPTLETVAARNRPALDPLGIRRGSFVLYPELGLEYQRDDNVLATPQEVRSDAAYIFRPGVALFSDWNRNALSAGANAAVVRFDDLTTEDHDNSSMFVRGRWDISNGSYLTGEIERTTVHEARESADDVDGTERARFTTDQTVVGYQFAPGRLQFEAELDRQTVDFDDVQALAGPINHDDRDRSSLAHRIRIGYQFFDGYSLFIQSFGRSTDYDDRFDDNGFERSSTDDEIVVGASIDIADVVFGSIYFGEKTEDFDDQRYSNIGGAAFGVDVAWNVTPLTTFTFSGRRQVAPTTVVTASGIDEESLGVRADHEILRNLIISVALSEETQDFQGSTRQDTQTFSTISARYMMNRRMELSFEYTDRDRDSNGDPGLIFSKNILSIYIKGQF